MSDGGDFQKPFEKATNRRIDQEVAILDRACQAKFISVNDADVDVPDERTIDIALTRLKSLSGFDLEDLSSMTESPHTQKAAGSLALCVAAGVDKSISRERVYDISNVADLGYDNRALLSRAVVAEENAKHLQRLEADNFRVARHYGDAAIHYDRILSRKDDNVDDYCVHAALGRSLGLAFGDEAEYPMDNALRQHLKDAVENLGKKDSFLTFERDEPKVAGHDLG